MSRLQPFSLHVPQAARDDLDQRLRHTRWLENSYLSGWQYGVPVDFTRELCRYWQEEFDWHQLEDAVNANQQCLIHTDGLQLHALYRRSQQPDAVPLLLLHGWPSSCLEFLDLLAPLATPPEGQPAFHPVAASLPGYGFSTTREGIGPQAIAPLLVELMDALGFERFMVQGGDWGSLVGTEIARQYPDRVIGLHLNLVNGSRPANCEQLPVSAEELAWIDELDNWLSYPHLQLQTQQPASISHAMHDSPAGLAAWIGEKFFEWTDRRAGDTVSAEQMLRSIALYWFSGCAGSAAQLYYEMAHNPVQERYVKAPTAAAIFPLEVVKLPRSWAEQHYNIVQWNVFAQGGHFPALEQPAALLQDLRQFAILLQGARDAAP
ncbi:epoxide hydrolase family protein [Haliea sp. E17]|uniref:epoxide hydrolase family protein n=1 Tax=Haliea sp. E17 TaxID=3401576 RepID=UPI003AAF8419